MQAMRYGIWMLAALCVPGALGTQPLTIRQAMETTRFMVSDEQSQAIAVSPDGHRYVAALVRGDVARDGVEVEIIAGGLDSLEAANPQSVARFFTQGLGAGPLGDKSDGTKLVMSGANFPVWIDDHRVALLWEDEKGVHQVMAVHVESKQVEQLTRSTMDVMTFAIGKRGLMYVAKQPWSLKKSDRLVHQGFVVTSTDAAALMLGVVDGSSLAGLNWGVGQHYMQVVDAGQDPPIAIAGLGGATYWLPFPAIRPSMSQDERWAVIAATPADAPSSWERYPERLVQMYLAEWRTNKLGIHARKLQQPFLVDLTTAQAQPLLDAPAIPFGTGAQVRWAPNNNTLLLGPTFLPLDRANEAGMQGYGYAVVNAKTRQWDALPVSFDAAHAVQDSRWVDDTTIELKSSKTWMRYKKRNGQWQTFGRSPISDSRARVRVEVRQGLNTPPSLYAVDTNGSSGVMVFDPNPALRRDVALGEVKVLKWQDADGRQWEGRLYLPVSHIPTHRYPLVIQNRGYGGTRDEFSLYGGRGVRPPLGPGWSVLLAQPLAGQGIAVLQFEDAPGGSITSTQSEAWVMTRGYDAAVEHLHAAGIIDRNRVGLMGYSRGGWYVSYALAFGQHQYAAAITDDNIDSGYVEAAMRAWTEPELRNGAEPFGEGMKSWLEYSPAFNAEHIRAPLLMMLSGGFVGRAGVVAQGWELFSRLRHLNKPVEFYVAPDIERGHHTLQNPRQLLGVQQRALDWWRFWLKDEVDMASEKQDQYVQWRKLQALRADDLGRPASPRLRWKAEPVGTCDIRQC